MIANKKELRTLFLNRRIALTEMDRSKLNDLLLIQFQKVKLPFAQVVLNYLPIAAKAEPNTFLFSHYLEFIIPELTLAYPVSDFQKGTMEAFAVNDDTEFEIKQFGLIEPISNQLIPANAIDLVIVPLIIADKAGYRVGYGKGMYDKYFSNCNADVLKIGFSFFEPIDKISDITEKDISLDILITPYKIYYF